MAEKPIEILAWAQEGERQTEPEMLSAGGTYRVWSPGPEAPVRFTSELLSIEATPESTTLRFVNRMELVVKAGDMIRFFRKL